MEMIKTTSFAELSTSEMNDIDGGVIFTAGAIIGGILFGGGCILGYLWAVND